MEKCKLLHCLICDREVSSSVLLYEVMYAILEHMALNPSRGERKKMVGGKNMHWIPDINIATYMYLDQCISNKMHEFIKDKVSLAEGPTIYAPYNLHSIRMYPEGICIGYMDIILAERKKLRFEEETEDIKYEIKVCEKFTRLCKNIS